MASTFSTTLRLELIGDGDQSGIWGQTTNTNLGTLLEQAITGVVSITMVDANYTLSNFNGVSDEARNAVLVVGGTNAAVRDIIAPLVEKLYVVKNNTVGGFGVRIIGSSGTGVTVPNGATVWVYCDGTNFNAVGTESVGNFEVNGNLAVTGNTNAVAATYTGNVAALNFSTANVTATGNVSATNLIGAGLTITSINASNISAGTIANARTTAASANGASTIVTRDSNGSFSANAGTFGSVSGDGSALTNLNASNLASGTVSSSRLSGTYNISISGTAATATSPASGGSFITSSNIGSQSVAFATNATNATNATTAANANAVFGLTKLGLGITGEVWYNAIAFGRTINATYSNSRSYPIMVVISVSWPTGGGNSITYLVDGLSIGYESGNSTTDTTDSFSFIVPANSSYRLQLTAGSVLVDGWAELF